MTAEKSLNYLELPDCQASHGRGRGQSTTPMRNSHGMIDADEEARLILKQGRRHRRAPPSTSSASARICPPASPSAIQDIMAINNHHDPRNQYIDDLAGRMKTNRGRRAGCAAPDARRVRVSTDCLFGIARQRRDPEADQGREVRIRAIDRCRDEYERSGQTRESARVDRGDDAGPSHLASDSRSCVISCSRASPIRASSNRAPALPSTRPVPVSLWPWRVTKKMIGKTAEELEPSLPLSDGSGRRSACARCVRHCSSQ